jgi:ankyrin repeat protein
VPAFFDGVQLHYSPARYAEYIGQNTTQNIELTSRHLQSLDMETRGGLAPISQFYGIYDADEWILLLRRLSEMIRGTSPPLDRPFSFFIGNGAHRITVGYTPETSFMVLDPNDLMNAFYRLDSQDIIHAFSTNGFAGMTTTIYCNADDKAILEPILQQWMQDERFKEVHEINEKNINRCDSNGKTWLTLSVSNLDISALEKCQKLGLDPTSLLNERFETAIYLEDLPAVDKCLKLGVDPNQLLGNLPVLYTAISMDTLEICQRLLAAGANPLQRIIDMPGYTPLSIALRDNKKDLVVTMVSHLLKNKDQHPFLSHLSDTEISDHLIKFASDLPDLNKALEEDFIGALRQVFTRNLAFSQEIITAETNENSEETKTTASIQHNTIFKSLTDTSTQQEQDGKFKKSFK